GTGGDTIFGDSGRVYFGKPGGGVVIVLGGAADGSVVAGLQADNDPDSADLVMTVVDPAADGNDTIDAGAGNDIVLGGLGNDAITGGAGYDVLIGDGGRVTLTTGQVAKVETTDPNAGGGDTISGNENDDVILGGAGDDTLSGDAGNDIVL